MWTPLYTGHFGLVPKVSTFRGSTVYYIHKRMRVGGTVKRVHGLSFMLALPSKTSLIKYEKVYKR